MRTLTTLTNDQISKAEDLFTSEHGFDRKNKLNRANEVNFDQSFFDTLKSEGLTSEYLDTIETPIFKYTGQITIHGIFPSESIERVGGYKNVTLNKNLSLGIKYNAIDYAKKKLLGSVFSTFKTGINYHRSSNDNYYFMQSADYNKVLDFYNTIDTSFFVGTKHLMKFNYYGTMVYIAIMRISAIYTKNVWPFVKSLIGKTETEYTDAVIQAKTEDEARYKELNEKWNAEKLVKQAERLKALEAIKDLTPWDKTFINGIALVSVNGSDYGDTYILSQLTKKGAYYTLKTIETNDPAETADFDNYRVKKQSYRTEADLLKRLVKGNYFLK